MVSFVNPGILQDINTFARLFEEPIEAMRQPDCTSDEKVCWIFFSVDCSQKQGRERGKYLSDLTANFILRRTSKVNQKYLPPKGNSNFFLLNPPKLFFFVIFLSSLS